MLTAYYVYQIIPTSFIIFNKLTALLEFIHTWLSIFWFYQKFQLNDFSIRLEMH